MVYLTSRFAILAVAASLAVVSTVDAAAISARHSESHVASKDDSHSGSPHKLPTLPLPAAMKKTVDKNISSKGAKESESGEKKKKGGKGHKERDVFYDDDDDDELAVVQIDLAKRETDQVFFNRNRFSRRAPHHDGDKVVLNGDHDDVHIHQEGHHHHHHDRRRPHHHHDHYDSDHDEVIVNGDHDDVHMHERRSSSSVLVHNNHGQSFIVTRAHHNIARRGHLGKRVDEDAPCGTIKLVLQNDAGQPKTAGSLFMNTDKNPFELDASDKNSTTTYMVEDSSMTRSDDPNVKYVLLHFHVNDSKNLTVVPWCATYNSRPDAPASMTVIPCHKKTDASTESNPDENQTFMYLVDSGVISPMSSSSSSSNATAAEAEDDSEDSSEDVDGGAVAATSVRARDTQAQNVTLIFMPDGPQENSASAQAADTDSGMYTTITETQTATVTVTASSTASAMAEDDSVSTSATLTSDASTASSSSTSINALDVEVFNATPSADPTSSSSSSVPTSTSIDTATSSATSSDASSTSVDAEAIASDIANPSSSSESAASSSVSTTLSSTSAGAASTASVASRAEMTAVDTAPYKWQFKRE